MKKILRTKTFMFLITFLASWFLLRFNLMGCGGGVCAYCVTVSMVVCVHLNVHMSQSVYRYQSSPSSLVWERTSLSFAAAYARLADPQVSHSLPVTASCLSRIPDACYCDLNRALNSDPHIVSLLYCWVTSPTQVLLIDFLNKYGVILAF